MRAILLPLPFPQSNSRYSLPCPRGKAPRVINIHDLSPFEQRKRAHSTRNWPNGNKDNNNSIVHIDSTLQFAKFLKCN